jgi:hypothetical protein
MPRTFVHATMADCVSACSTTALDGEMISKQKRSGTLRASRT